MSISAVILAKNEENNLKTALESVKSFSEILVIDDNSTDKTSDIAKLFGAKVFKRSLGDDFSAQRNFGLRKASSKWVLFLDADEFVSDGLIQEIHKVVGSNDKFNGFEIKRQNFFKGKILRGGEVGSRYIKRLVKNGEGKWYRSVHEELSVNGKVGRLKGSIYHNSGKTVREFIDSVNTWSDMHTKANQAEGKNSNTIKIILWPVMHFIKNFFFKRGYKDGTRGLVFAILMSFHSFLSWSKGYLKK